ncbi:MAG: CHAD domain-containing protein [Pontiellaceae bacterium]|nr:CHAD domain-containing protein [Pontiellaceae bacterium]MBN2785389.1 CHAD domain-containing protein [Pontiellaceae bacterium]
MEIEENILGLEQKYSIESPHTEHVSKLAETLFEAFRKECGLRKRHLKLLQVAGWLHDIAYSTDSRNHVIAAGRLLADNRVGGFEHDEWLMVIGVILLHKRDWRSMLKTPEFPRLDGESLLVVKKLAAMLRIADGLDHGHLQDASIVYCRRGKKVDRIGVHCRWYENNIVWAEGKADLWETICKRPFRIEGSSDRPRLLYEGLVRKSDPLISVVRRILYSQWCTMRDNVPGMLDSGRPECLHDYRVALRRFRAILKLFRSRIDVDGVDEILQRLGNLSDQLGEARDLHVAEEWLIRLSDECEIPAGRMDELQEKVRHANETVRTVLQSEECMATVNLISRFLRIDLPRLERSLDCPAFAVYACDIWPGLLPDFSGFNIDELRSGNEELLHETRKEIRRARYHAEFLAPAGGKEVRRMAKNLRSAVGALGDVRDLRAVRQWLNEESLEDAAVESESKAWSRFDKVWSRLVS